MNANSNSSPIDIISLLSGGLVEPKSTSQDPLYLLASYRSSLERSSEHLRVSESLYQRALANGIDEIVERFLSTLADCEITVLGHVSNGAVETRGQINIRFALRHFISAFPALDIFITDVIFRNLYGGPLLSSLYHRSQDGDEFISMAFSSLLWHASQPFFGQITKWMAHAEVDHPCELGGGKDFFIRQTGSDLDRENRQSSALVIASTISEGSGKTSTIGHHEVRVLASRSLLINGDKVPTAASIVLSDNEKGVDCELKQAFREFDWTRKYSLHYEAVPVPFISETLAEAILAVGKAVSLLKFNSELRSESEMSDSADHPTKSIGFLLEDSLAISALLESIRSSSNFSLVAAECIVNRIQEFVYNRLWRVIVQDSQILNHVSAVRSFLLLGRGDFFQAFLELSRKTVVTTPATSPSVLSILRTGPWEGAAALVNLRSEDFTPPQSKSKKMFTFSPSEGSHCGHEAFDRVSLTISHRAIRFEGMFCRSLSNIPEITTESDGLIGIGDKFSSGKKSSLLPGTRIGFCSSITSQGQNRSGDLRSRNSQPINQSHQKSRETCAGLLSLWTQPCNLNSAERIYRIPRSSAQLLLLGTSSFETFKISSEIPSNRANRSLKDGDTSDTTIASAGPSMLDRNITIASQSSHKSNTHVIDRLILARPHIKPIPLPTSRVLPSSQHVPTGATWIFQPMHVSKGFLCRISLGLGSSTFSSTNTEQPASFAFVIHRDHALALGVPNNTLPTVSNSGGFSGIQNSIAMHFLCKRIQSSSVDPVFRIVVAIYGPPDPSNIGKNIGERHLIASSVLETSLQAEGVCAIPTGSFETDMACRCLALSIEYLPPGSTVIDQPLSTTSATSGTPSTRIQLGSRGRIQVSVLEGASVGCLSYSNATTESRRASIMSDLADINTLSASLPSQQSLFQRVVLETPLVIDEVLNFVGVEGPGRGRAWVGLTSESAVVSFSGDSDVKPIISAPLVWLDALDFVSYSEADEGYLGLGLRYDAPWPLHLVIHSGSLAVYQDLFRFGLRVKSVALALQETWRLLTDLTVVDVAIGLRRGGGRITARIPAAEDGVSAQVTGRGGKSSDPAIRARDLKRRSAHVKLHALWLVRSQLQLFVSGLLYHIQVDVIECSYVRFVKNASDAKSFGTLQIAHDDYLRSLLDGSGILQPSVNACITRLLSHCDRFVSLVSTHAQSDSLLELSSSSVLTELEQVFQNDKKAFENCGGFPKIS